MFYHHTLTFYGCTRTLSCLMFLITWPVIHLNILFLSHIFWVYHFLIVQHSDPYNQLYFIRIKPQCLILKITSHMNFDLDVTYYCSSPVHIFLIKDKRIMFKAKSSIPIGYSRQQATSVFHHVIQNVSEMEFNIAPSNCEPAGKDGLRIRC